MTERSTEQPTEWVGARPSRHVSPLARLSDAFHYGPDGPPRRVRFGRRIAHLREWTSALRDLVIDVAVLAGAAAITVALIRWAA